MPENSSPLAARSLYPGLKLMTTGTGKPRRTGDDRDHSRAPIPKKTAESPLPCCHSASRRGNAGINDRSNYREGSTRKIVTILSHHSSTPTRLRPPKLHMLLSSTIDMEPTQWPPRVKLSPHKCCAHHTARTLGPPPPHAPSRRYTL